MCFCRNLLLREVSTATGHHMLPLNMLLDSHFAVFGPTSHPKGDGGNEVAHSQRRRARAKAEQKCERLAMHVLERRSLDSRSFATMLQNLVTGCRGQAPRGSQAQVCAGGAAAGTPGQSGRCVRRLRFADLSAPVTLVLFLTT